MQLIIIKGDITTIECDAIISSTNSELVPSGDIDTAVHSVAGPALTKACAKIAHCEVGSCVVTDGYNLPCKYVIHTVAPYAYEDSSAHLLAQCYKNSIKRAVHKGCTSIAFPLIGSGNKGFSTKKALDVALNRLEVCMRSESGDFTIYLVLFDDETKSLAMLRAKELIDEKYLAFGDDGQVDEVLPVDKRWISLCKVNRPDKNKDIWMQRLADSVGGTLVAPAFDEAKEKIFDNRPLIFCDDGPNDPDNIGFWEWTERQTETGRWLSDATYIEQPTPIEIIILDKLSSIGEVVEALKTGLHIPAYVRCSVLFAVKKDTDIEGVLCDLSNFNTRPGNDVFITIKNNIYTLPYYELSEHDIFTWKYRKIYKYISLNEPQKRIPVYALAETIKQMLLQRMSWPVFKAQGISKSDWQKFKQFLSEIPKDSILEKLAEMYDMSPQEAQACVESFLQTVENYVHAEDVDSTLIVQMLDNHKGLKQTCDEFAYKKWCGEHKVETEKAKEEVVAIRAKAEQEAVAAKQRLLDIEKSISSAEAKRNNILSEITTAQSRLDQLHTEIMGWGDNDPIAAKWSRILREKFMDEGQSSNGKYYIDLSRVKPRFDLEHTWFRCERCSELTPYLLREKCPSCQCEKIHPMTAEEIDALDFWRAPIDEALRGETIRVIDTEEHTAQLSHKDQRDELWSKTEQYELRFQDFLQDGEAPVDILSSTTTMEVGIDIGSLVAVGLRNIPPMRENYQQRAGRAGRRGSSLSTIVTFCEDGPHDSLYFSNPVPIFRGDPRRPWIDIGSEKIVQRHLGMVALQSYLRTKANSLDAISAIEFLDDHLQPFSGFLTTFEISENDILVPANSQGALYSYKGDLEKSLFALKQKRDNHPELFETDDNSDSGKKTLLDALYEEGVIPTYSFPKNVVSTYISDMGGKVKYQVERGLDVAIGEYAPGRAIVVDKTTYQIGGLYYPGGERSERIAASPARSFINDASYRKTIRTCGQCGWFGLEEDNHEACPFCGNSVLTNMLPMLRPWGFAPRNATSIETAQLNEEYTATQQPLYSTLPDADDVTDVDGCANIRMAVRPNQRIIMLNKGVGGKGFTICCDCGAAMPGDDPVVLKDILRPYRSKFNKTRCRHTDTDNVNLGYDFVTDMLVLEFALDRQLIDINPQRNSWLNRAGQSLAEALRLAACQELDIEFTELVTGYRVRHNQNGDFVDVYLYDSLSSGAGYAVSIESSIQKLLTKTRELLAGCSCDSACHKCLKHYRNQYIHSVLDRKAALDLLNWGETGIRTSALPDKNQQYLLQSLEQILQISGVHIDVKHDPVWAEGRYSKKKVVVYPAMWTKPVEENTIFVSDAHLKYAKPYALKTILDSL